MFKGIKDSWEKSKAATVISQLLEKGPHGGMERYKAAKLSRMLVDRAWESYAQILDGQSGMRPHKLTLAAFTLANALNKLPEDNQISSVLALNLALLVSIIDHEWPTMSVNPLDDALMNLARDALSNQINAFVNSDLGRELQSTFREAGGSV